jgi:ABC-type xylose transport system permease subunit
MNILGWIMLVISNALAGLTLWQFYTMSDDKGAYLGVFLGAFIIVPLASGVFMIDLASNYKWLTIVLPGLILLKFLDMCFGG